MLTLRKMVVAAAVVGSLAMTQSPAQAAGRGCNGPFCNTPRYPELKSYLFQGHFFGHNQPKPTFQAAPWYLYWPYDGHFLTPAPVHAPFYGPPGAGNFPVNPYFPAPAGYYGPIPGGGAPGGVPITPPGFGPGVAPPAPPAPLPRP